MSACGDQLARAGVGLVLIYLFEVCADMNGEALTWQSTFNNAVSPLNLVRQAAEYVNICVYIIFLSPHVHVPLV